MRTWVFRMYRCRIERLPRRVNLRRGVTVDIAIAYRGNRPPEFVAILRIEHGDVGIGEGCGKRGHESSAVDQFHAARGDDLTGKRVVGLRSHHQPELCGLGLLWVLLR